MASIDTLRASDGSGNASVATIQSVRAPAATTLVVDTIQGINDTFHATMGTPHTYVDPVTSETITVISEDSAVDFQGHVDGTNLEIDVIAPGYTDNGSSVNDIIIIKPTTQWADEVADVLDEQHKDDGTHGDITVDSITTNPGGSVDFSETPLGTDDIDDGAVTAAKWTNPYKFSAYLTAGQNVGTAATKVNFNMEVFDTNNNYDASTNYRYTAPVAGFYQFNANVVTTTAGSGTTIAVHFYKNGSLVSGPEHLYSVAGHNPGASISAFLQLAANDYIEVFVSTGVAAKALDVSNNGYNVFSGFLVSET